ncbi:MAG TPA: DUF4276 family protein [Flavobacterium sp.]|nr:DUF4276 family protein [Flavobacterium sp.]
MSNFILTGLFTEGSTDVRFLESVVKNTLEDIAFECTGNIETGLEIIEIDKKGLSFNQQVFRASEKAMKDFGILILFVHTDADEGTDSKIFINKIDPAQEYLNKQDNGVVCKNLVAIVPVYMTESWMLADKKLLKSEIGIEGSDTDLGIHKDPEGINDPKAVIENIIRLSKENQTKRKRKSGLEISDLYQIIGQKIEFKELEKLPSYNKFKLALKSRLVELNFLHK